MRNVLLALSVLAALLLAPGVQGVSHAQGPCAPPGSPPQCDGACPPGQECVQDILGNPANCICEASIAPCGSGPYGSPPECWGECPPHIPICAVVGPNCECVVPTLSEWGIIAMSLVMFGGVIYMRRRRADQA